MTNFREALAQIKTTVDIADYIMRSGVKLESSGANKFKGLCPFHGEKTPSFYVDTVFQNYKCFGCQASGDIFSYVESSENLDFKDAVNKLAEENNIEIKINENETSIDYKSLRECIKAAAKFFVKNFRELSKDHPARLEITNRGLPINGITYGYALEGRRSLYTHLHELGYSDEIIAGTGVCRAFASDPSKLFDFWNGRLMFIITDATGKPVGFSGRKLFEDDKRGKYVNSVDGPLFNKSAVLFNHSKAKKPAADNKMIFVAEGQFDVAAISASGYENVVAASGTSFTKKQAFMCSRMVGENGKVVFCFDGDEAGQKAALKVFTTAPEIQTQAYVVPIPEGVDPCDYRQDNGDEALKELLNNQVTMVDFVLTVTANKYDTNDETQIVRYVNEAASILKTISNKTLLSLYLKKVSIESGLEISAINEAVDNAKKVDSENFDTTEDDLTSNVLTVEERIEKTDSEEEIIQKIEESTIYDLYARILTLAFYERRLFKTLVKVNVLPKEFNSIISEGGDLSKDSKIIPEQFEKSALVAYLIGRNFFPYIDVMDENEIKKMFLTLHKEIIKNVESVEQKRYAKRMISTFDSLGSNDVSILETAISKEPKIN